MRRVVVHWRTGTFTMLSSSTTRAELADVLARPAIRQLAVAPLDELVRGLERFSEHVPGVLDLAGACRDSKACGELSRTILRMLVLPRKEQFF